MHAVVHAVVPALVHAAAAPSALRAVAPALVHDVAPPVVHALEPSVSHAAVAPRLVPAVDPCALRAVAWHEPHSIGLVFLQEPSVAKGQPAGVINLDKILVIIFRSNNLFLPVLFVWAP